MSAKRRIHYSVLVQVTQRVENPEDSDDCFEFEIDENFDVREERILTNPPGAAVSSDITLKGMEALKNAMIQARKQELEMLVSKKKKKKKVSTCDDCSKDPCECNTDGDCSKCNCFESKKPVAVKLQGKQSITCDTCLNNPCSCNDTCVTCKQLCHCYESDASDEIEIDL
jgi:hypothetical protein